jgi:lipid-A-disaccharide synthase-like uncharacterized protein
MEVASTFLQDTGVIPLLTGFITGSVFGLLFLVNYLIKESKNAKRKSKATIF